AGATVTQDLEVDAPSSSITGAIEFDGPEAVDRYRVYASGPAYKNLYLNSPFGPLNDVAYQLTDLPDGTFTVGLQAQLNGYDDYVTFPRSTFDSAFTPPNRPAIVSGSSPVVNITASQAFIEGAVTLGGTMDNSDLSWFQITSRTSGYSESGYSQDRLDLGTGNYDLIVTPGDWVIDGYRMTLNRSETDPDGYLNESIYVSDYVRRNDVLTVAAGETVYRDLDLPMGSVTITFTVSGGGLLSNPRLRASCYEYSDSTGELLRYYNFNSSSTGQIDVTTGQVSVVGLKGDCTVIAQAYVGGSLTSFGEFSLEIEPGVEQEVEIGGPSLSVDIESGFCIDADEITVTGLATDDVEVASVTVNGVAATLTVTGGIDPNEVGFSLVIPIAGRGAHEIITVATDTSGKTATDTRTIYNDDGLPTLTFTPADGSTFPVTQTSVAVAGTVVDESDVSVTLDGTVVTTDAAGAFSGNVAVATGENFITVVATDDCGSTTVTHKVTLIDNQPPVAVCQDVTVATGAVCSADADVNNGSSDPDGDPITLTPDPTSPYPLGATEVSLTVDDGSASDSCIATVTVEDLSAPAINLNPGAETIECQLETYDEPGAEVSDVCDPNVEVTIAGSVDSTLPGAYAITYDASDASGNAAMQKVRDVTVVDSTAPVIALTGELSLTLQCGVDAYTELGAVASDACDTEVPVTIGGASPNTALPGFYEVTYDASDDSLNPATQAVRSVAVVDTIAPVITACPTERELLVDPFTGLTAVPDLATETGASDACSLALSQVPVAGTALSAGTQMVTIEAFDGFQTTTCTVTLTVLDRVISSDEKVKVHWHDDDSDSDSDSDNDSDGDSDGDTNEAHCFAKLDLDGQLRLRNPASLPIDVRQGLDVVDAQVVVSLAGYPIADQTVTLNVKDGNDEKWEYKRSGGDPKMDLKKVKLDWKDQAEYDSHEGTGLGSDVPRIETRFIGFDETDIKMKFKDVARPFTIEFADGGETFSVTVLDAQGNVMITPAGSYDVKDKKDKLELTLPFRLTPETTITLADSLANLSSIPVDPEINYAVSSAKYMVDLDRTVISDALCGPDPL
ncbi:MAG: DUF5011 domain-containing protein, partial [Acidimicrobiia bacterium]|nr:DUF5011 domain-containing protein [Acidimicrobiia bacterium]